MTAIILRLYVLLNYQQEVFQIKILYLNCLIVQIVMSHLVDEFT
jgi:hypothetical protein